ncbi:MAG: ribbon-helix-helix domain-containing protein [Elusimicrobiota bacterium]
MENTVRWSLIVSRETDISLRTYLSQKGMRKGDLSKFVEEAVKWRVLDKIVHKTKQKNERFDSKEIELAINEAVQSVRTKKKTLK